MHNIPYGLSCSLTDDLGIIIDGNNEKLLEVAEDITIEFENDDDVSLPPQTSTPLRKGNIMCDACGKKFTRKDALLRHIRSQHNNDRVPCPDCQKTFRDSHEVKIHRLSCHDNLFYACIEEGCARSFRTKTALREHAKVHNGDWRYRCEKCGKGFQRKQLFEDHVATHDNIKPLSCSECGKSFTTHSNAKVVIYVKAMVYLIV